MFVVILAEVTVSQGGEGNNCKYEVGEGRGNASQGSADGRSMVGCGSDGQTRSMMLWPTCWKFAPEANALQIVAGGVSEGSEMN